ncbi:MAG TPA: ABC transporter permease [Acidobacteriota bacterium]|nr:ABC transporter permease [Acidobacteriota bacterium]
MNAFVHHFAYEFKTGIRDRSQLLMLYLFPLIFFVLTGSLMTSLNPGFKQTMIPGMLLLAFMSSTLLSLPNLLVNARESGVFRSYRINGVPSASILGIPVMATGVHMAVIGTITSVAGVRLYGGVPPAHVAGFLTASLLSYAAFAAMGALIGVAAGNNTASILISQIIFIPSILLGGIMVPSSALPVHLRRVSLLLPATHGMQIFNGLAMGGADRILLSIGVLVASATLNSLLAGLLFEWDSRASRTGRKAYAALIGISPYLVAALIGTR